MKRALVIAALMMLATPALATGPGGSGIFGAHCARCHVVGQGQALADTKPAFIDITLAAKKRDEKWLLSFLQRPTSVAPDSACRAKLDENSAREVYRYLRTRLKPLIPDTVDQGGARRPWVPKVPPASNSKLADPLPPKETPKHRRQSSPQPEVTK